MSNATGELHKAHQAASELAAKAEKRAGLLSDVEDLQGQNGKLGEQVARQADSAAPFEQERQRIMRCALTVLLLGELVL